MELRKIQSIRSITIPIFSEDTIKETYRDTEMVKIFIWLKILGVVVLVDREGLAEMFAVLISSFLKVVRQTPRQTNTGERTVCVLVFL